LLERARAADPRRHFDAAELRDLASIAARVDGLPLAIEMTAARLRTLAPAEILARLDDRFGLLTGGARTAVPRHRTLRATLDWSYDLVGVPEQLMLRRFSVFAGAIGGDHATAVCAGGILAAGEVTDILGSLVDRSLVVVSPGRGSRNRYRLLDTVREYGRVRLREAGEEDAMLQRHLDWCIDLAEQAHRAHVGNEAEWVANLSTVLDELRVALGRAPGLGGDRELKLAGCLGWFWAASGRLSEGRQVTERALAGDGNNIDRARALAGLGSVAGLMGDSEATLVRLEEALSLWQQLGERKEECAAYDSLGWAHFWPGHDQLSLEAFRAGLSLARELNDPDLINRLMTGECQVHVALGDVKAARPLAAELVRGAPKRDLRTAQLGQHFLVDCALIEDDCLSAATQYLTSLDLALQLDDPLEATFELQGFAMAQAGLGRGREALLLGGAAEASLEALQMDLNVPFWLALLDKWLRRAREALGATAAEAWQEGRSLTLHEAAGLAHHLPGSTVGDVSVDDQTPADVLKEPVKTGALWLSTSAS
jgi:tetratricopeptide (TPR) repeat protein